MVVCYLSRYMYIIYNIGARAQMISYLHAPIIRCSGRCDLRHEM